MSQPPDLPPYNPYATPVQPPVPPPVNPYSQAPVGPNPYAQNPYAAPNAALVNASQQVVRLATRGSRLGAFFLDGLIYVGPMFLALFLLGFNMRGSNPDQIFDDVFTGWIGLVGLWAIGVLVVNCVFLHQNGQTIAKKILGIKVIQVDGNRVELWRFFFLRYLPVALMGSVLSIFATILDGIFIFGNEQRCLHDLIANTIVVEV
jgi:uncharacterized RDD family membrane protein YckC